MSGTSDGSRPRNAAWELRREKGIKDTDAVEMSWLMGSMNIRYREEVLGDGILGACMASGLRRLIVVDSNIGYETRKRFTIAHEIGHLLMHQGQHRCTERMLKEYLANDQIEQEANEFASELLLPGYVIQARLQQRLPSIELARYLSKQYGVSLTAALISIVRYADGEAAFVYHDGNKVDWTVRSDSLKLQSVTEIDRSPVTRASYFERKSVDGIVPLEKWFLGIDPEMYICQEDTIYFRNLKKYATIINLQKKN